MKLPLIAACFVAGSTWSFAFADQATAINPKTATKPFSQQTLPRGTKVIYTSKNAPPTIVNGGTPAKPTEQELTAQKQQYYRELNAAKAAELMRMKLAAEQNPPQQMSQGIHRGNPQGQPGTLNLNGGDDCSAADVISGNGTWTFDNTAATTSPQQSGICGTSNHDVWFQWTATQSGTATMSFCGLTSLDTLIAVYNGAGCPAGSAIVCNDDSCGLQSQVSFAASAGSTYMLQVGSWSTVTTGSGSFTMSTTTPDDCSTPTVISGTGTFNFDTTAATTGTQGQTEAACLAYGTTIIDNDIWYTWTASATGTATMSMCGGSGLDSRIAAYPGAGCPAAGTALACNDDFCGLQSQISFPVTGGAQYTLQLGAYPGAGGASGTFTMNVLSSVAGDDCSTPISISGQGTYAYDTTGASTSPQQVGLCATAGQDIWFSWTAPVSGTAVMNTCGLTSYDTVLAAWPGPGCPTAGTGLTCNDDTCGLQSQITFPVTAGSQYMLQVGGFGGNSGPGSFSLTVSLPSTNDDCTAPTVITGLGSFPYNNVASTTGTQGQNEALCLFYGMTTIDHDVWFQWTAPGAGCTIIDNCGDGLDAKIAVYAGAGCPAAGTAIACNDDSCGLQSKVTFTATAGQTYTIQFGTFPGAGGSIGSFNINQAGGGIGNDECSAPTVISGVGVFPFDNTLATTGCEGQAETLCAGQYGQLPVENDVWFQWTAPTTGFAVWDDCGLTGVDTKVAAYLGTGCPATGTALACWDDSCPGFQTTVAWPVTAGTTYTIQVGTFPGALGGVGSFSLNVVLPPANDDCTGIIALAPTGPYPFSLLGSSTGAQGQSEALCNFYGLTAVENDIWYSWTAPSSGRANLTLCAGSAFDSKVAVYPGNGCPAAGTAIACNDDACGLTSEVCFDVVGGQTYTIQVGTFPGAGNNFTGSFDILLGPSLPPCTWDDGTTENLLTWFAGGEMAWLNRFGTPGGSTVLNSVSVTWGSAMFPGYNPGNGTPTDVFIWQDGVTQDGDPSDATLLLTIPTTVQNVDTDTYVTFPIAPLTISGVFFVGTHQDSYGLSGAGPTQFVAPMDQNCPAAGVAWFFGNNSGFGTSPCNFGNPGSNVQPPVAFTNVGYACQVTCRAGCNAGPATYLCDPGSGPTIACPCSNPPSGSGKGCDNSSSTGGASITGAGTNSLSTPTVAFTTAGEKPTATSILLQGTASNTTGLVFGQGVRCVSGVLKRMYLKTASGGSITAPNLGGGDLDIPTRSANLGDPISPGQSRWYLVYYRDPIVLGGCSFLSTFNATNTAEVVWQP